MSRLVIDASMALSWLLRDESSGASLAVRAALTNAASVRVPGHWRLEVANARCMAERTKRLDAAGVPQTVSLFTQFPVSLDPEASERASAETLALARQHTLSVYDAAYLELALRRGVSLATLDGPLRRVAKKLGVPVLPKKLPAETEEFR